jgi:hypothetical protein
MESRDDITQTLIILRDLMNNAYSLIRIHLHLTRWRSSIWWFKYYRSIPNDLWLLYYMRNTTSIAEETNNSWKGVQRTNERTGTHFPVRTMPGRQHPVLGNVLSLAVRTAIKRWGLMILRTYPLGSRWSWSRIHQAHTNM